MVKKKKLAVIGRANEGPPRQSKQKWKDNRRESHVVYSEFFGRNQKKVEWYTYSRFDSLFSEKRQFFCLQLVQLSSLGGGRRRLPQSDVVVTDSPESLAGKVKAFKEVSLALLFVVFPLGLGRLVWILNSFPKRERGREGEGDVRGSTAKRVGSERRSGRWPGRAPEISGMERQQCEFCSLFSVANLGFFSFFFCD